MTESQNRRSPAARRLAIALAAAGILFWLYTIVATARLPAGDGTGFEWLGQVPLIAILAIFILPAWLLIMIGRGHVIAAAMAACGLGAFAIVWSQLLGEFAGR